MRVVGILSEFNPFHKGHKYLIDKVKEELNPACIIAVMSGNFVQRGEPAMWDKWTRAACAVENGVDLVFELPVCFAVNSAQEFAGGGVRLLKGLQAVTDLAFGSESGDAEALSAGASLLVREEQRFSIEIKLALKTGISYPAAYEQAFRKISEHQSGDYNSLLRGSNDILALEYIKQINSQAAKFAPYAVKRAGLGHDQGQFNHEFPSASIIRQHIKSTEGVASAKEVLPEKTFSLLEAESYFSEKDETRYFALLRNAILVPKKEELAGVLSVTEGLENNLKNSLLTASGIDELILGAKSKRHTYAKISRILVQALLGITKERYANIRKSNLIYARVLGFNSAGAGMLRLLQNGTSQIPIWTNINKNIDADDPRRDMLLLDILASDMYSIIKGTSIYSASDYVREPYRSKTEQKYFAHNVNIG
jgi:predicted nucleotidyltransferase